MCIRDRADPSLFQKNKQNIKGSQSKGQSQHNPIQKRGIKNNLNTTCRTDQYQTCLLYTSRSCGRSGLKLPAISLGLWHNFGDTGNFDNMKQLLFTAFDQGITHFDLANNYGPAPGSAERNFGRILKEDLASYRDELLISTKAGYDMWPGPYGNWGSRKYLLSSLDQSLKRMNLDYVDIFYHHRICLLYTS